MQDLKKMELIELLDLLLEHTENHTQLIANGSSFEQFTKSEEELKQIQQEIEIRKQSNVPKQGSIE
jgi:hypothetical protein